MKMNHALLILTGALLLGGCSSTTVSYGDPTETETVTVDYGSSDLQAIADKMADSMLASPATSEITAGGRPVMFMDSIATRPPSTSIPRPSPTPSVPSCCAPASSASST